ncbi:SGNH/GDSL hydrolase family protein [Niabella beijingensis]|uniref:SGNH/GDSL hydrolase family protein n=1 Tax=Niabella beijingensis TaxID=2872700 RepID=UPI001CBD7368|nr:SGNH/GDSL hydrolase family protein [Niabella beijingensis]MBZ4190634.1 SGNH/GDSL hydrolase family protein [Niabella beijingensis]
MNYKLGLLLVAAGICLHSSAQVITDQKEVTWKGFKRVMFKLNGNEAWYTVPRAPQAGRPWVWRAYFPEWHTEMDSILLSKGVYIAYINASDRYGHSSAMNRWDDLYTYLTTQQHFEPRPALEAVSRGGLYAYGWAKRNPSKVSCIYAEAPVCDFTSWPAGKGKGKGAPGEWKQLLNVYGLTETQALQYADQPKDNLEALAAYKVPIVHVIGLQDKIVPAEENTLVLVQNYIRNGGPATVIPMTRGKQELEGHHFPIENVEALAGFVYEKVLRQPQPLPAADFIHPYGKLDNLLYRIRHKETVTVAFLGGSITNMTGWRNKEEQYLAERYPETRFRFLNAGIPSLGSLPHAFRLQKDVLDQGRIDLLFIEAAVNDRVNGTPEIRQRRALEGIVRHALSANPAMDIVLMGFADEFKLADLQAGNIPPEITVHETVARHYGLPFINLAAEVSARIAHKEFTWDADFKNLHPAPFGQALYFNSIKTLLQMQLSGETPEAVVPKKIPGPMDPLNYAGGRYVPAKEASIQKGFVLHPSWQPSDGVGTRPGFVNVPVLEGTAAGAQTSLAFQGSSVGIAVVSGPDAGTIRYSIDGGPEQTVDLYTQWSSGLHLPWYLLLGDGLKKGRHRLNLTIADQQDPQSKGHAVRIVYFLVNGK